LLALALVAGCGQLPPREQASAVADELYVDPRMLRLTPDQRLDRACAGPGLLGAVRGTTGVPTTHRGATGKAAAVTDVVSDFPLVVRGYFGRSPAPFRPGDPLTLRVPGGVIGGEGTAVEDAPQVAAHEDLFVLVHGQQTDGAGTGATITATNQSEVFEVRGGSVHGRWPYDMDESVDVFARHFSC